MHLSSQCSSLNVHARAHNAVSGLLVTSTSSLILLKAPSESFCTADPVLVEQQASWWSWTDSAAPMHSVLQNSTLTVQHCCGQCCNDHHRDLPRLLVRRSVFVLSGFWWHAIAHVNVLLTQLPECNLGQVCLDRDLTRQHFWPQLLHHGLVLCQDPAGMLGVVSKASSSSSNDCQHRNRQTGRWHDTDRQMRLHRHRQYQATWYYVHLVSAGIIR